MLRIILLSALALACAVVAIALGAQQYLASSWFNDAHQKTECETAAAIGDEIQTSTVLDAEFAKQFPTEELKTYSPVLHGMPSVRTPLEKVAYLFRGKKILLDPRPLNCGTEFSEHHLSQVKPHQIGQLPEDFEFSRIAFSMNGDTAYVFVRMTCGNLCGYGWDTIWYRQGHQWKLGHKSLAIES